MVDDEDILIHYGVIGMKWGHRKSVPHSADHQAFSEIRKKKLRDMTDDELRTLTKRVKLVKSYRDTVPFFNRKRVTALSNTELENETRRGLLAKEDRNHGVRKDKAVSKMTDDEVKTTLNRYYLEKPYRQYQRQELENAQKVVGFLLAMGTFGSTFIMKKKTN